MTGAPTRPVLRYYGGKWRIAPWIIGHFGAHRVYTEAFGGAASVLLRKPRSASEIFNDLDDDVVTLFRVLRSERADELVARLRLTPFARAEFEDAYLPAADPVDRAAALVTRCYLGHGSGGANADRTVGFRSACRNRSPSAASDWATYPDHLGAVIDRLRGVVIERRPAEDILRRCDGPSALHYVDPPYMPDLRTRANWHPYACDMTDADHAALLDQLRDLQGMVVLSGYPSDVYDVGLPGWHSVRRQAVADGGRRRTECLWLNPAAWAALGRRPVEQRALPLDRDQELAIVGEAA